MVRLLNASISQPPSTPESWGLRMGVARCETVTASSWCTGLGVPVRHSFLPNEPKINCNENTNNDKCSLPVIVAESLIDIVVIIGKALQQLQPGTAPCISAFFTISGSKRYGAAPRPAPARASLSGVEGLTYMTVCGTMSWFPAANSLLEFLCLIIQKARSLKSWKNLISNPHYHFQKNCSWFKEKKLSQSCRPSKKLTVIIHNTQRRNTRRLLRGFALLEMT